jgi:polysaccharide export outer membrane protein
MTRRKLKALSVLLFTILLTACASREDMVYFQGIKSLKTSYDRGSIDTRFKPDDQLSITVSSIDNEAAMPFNLPVAAFNVSGSRGVGSPLLQTYLIAKDGTIEYPQLGKLSIVGLTRLETIELFKKKLRTFLKDPIVNITLLNFKFTVLGEVNNPGLFPLTNERITLIEAIGRAGDLTVYGKRKNVLVIRETEGGKKINRIDLTTPDLFNSEFFYLQQNDVIYVEPNKPRINSSTNSSTNGIIISGVSLLLTIISISLR